MAKSLDTGMIPESNNKSSPRKLFYGIEVSRVVVGSKDGVEQVRSMGKYVGPDGNYLCCKNL